MVAPGEEVREPHDTDQEAAWWAELEADMIVEAISSGEVPNEFVENPPDDEPPSTP